MFRRVSPPDRMGSGSTTTRRGATPIPLPGNGDIAARRQPMVAEGGGGEVRVSRPVCFIEVVFGIGVMLAVTGVSLGIPVWLAIKVGEATGREWIGQIALYGGLIGIVFFMSHSLLKHENDARSVIGGVGLFPSSLCSPRRAVDEHEGESAWIRR